MGSVYHNIYHKNSSNKSNNNKNNNNKSSPARPVGRYSTAILLFSSLLFPLLLTGNVVLGVDVGQEVERLDRVRGDAAHGHARLVILLRPIVGRHREDRREDRSADEETWASFIVAFSLLRFAVLLDRLGCAFLRKVSGGGVIPIPALADFSRPLEVLFQVALVPFAGGAIPVHRLV